MRFSHSMVDCYNSCPYKYKLRYIDKVKILRLPEPNDPLIMGNTMHTAIEKDVETALNWYFMQYPIITDKHIDEAIKVETLVPKVKRLLSEFEKATHEIKISTPELIGYVDFISRDGTLLDFKYSNNVDRYLDSAQIHLYRYFINRPVSKLGYLFIPKTFIRQKKTETLYHFRKRLQETLDKMEPQIKYVPYDPDKVIGFLRDCLEINRAKDYPKNPTKLCDWCDYKKLCNEGDDYLMLPENKRRVVEINTTPDMWLYGDSYSGKTTFMDSFDDVLMINTDGNVDNISSPVFRIKDEVTVDGRITRRKFAWDVFLDVLAELEKKENTFKTIVIDLVEDLFEHCRLYMYDKLKIEHEQDAGFGKGWDMVSTEFLANMKRLKNMGYQIVYISKMATREITLRGGERISTFSPNIRDKAANVLSGTVDLTARVVADGDKRFLSFKTSPYIFGGSRYNFGVTEIPLNKDEFLKVLTESQTKTTKEEPKTKERTPRSEPETEVAPEQTIKPEPTPELEPEDPPAQVEEKPTRRRRRSAR